MPARLSAGAPDHTSHSPRARREKRASRAVEQGKNTNAVSLNTFPADRTVSLKLWVGKEGRDNRRKKKKRERHKTLKNSTAEWPNYSASAPGPENPVGRKLENTEPTSRDLPCADVCVKGFLSAILLIPMKTPFLSATRSSES